MRFKVLIITSGQPALNPRLVKEADALSAAGYEVTVLYAYWNDWGTRFDKQLLPEKHWDAVCIGGDPQQNKAAWFLSRLIHKTVTSILKKSGNFKSLADIAIARSSYFLIRAAKKYKADLYIAHNLGALPAAVKTATHYKKPCGFDAEDFHRQEVSDDANSYPFKIAKFIEDRYLPQVNYITASSPLIAGRYASLYNRPITTLLNVFPKTWPASIVKKEHDPLKLFWFSQTIGPNRGLELIIEAVGLTVSGIELHILGNPANGYQEHLMGLAAAAEIGKDRLCFYPPVKADELFNIAAGFDVGLASETGFCLNNSMALSNKIFTFIQSGLAVVASNTPAQSALINQYPETGKIYNNAKELSGILLGYNADREQLYQTKKASFTIGQTELNWEIEGQKFLGVITGILNSSTIK